MGTKTLISWTDHTFNPWIGCQKVSKGCDNCYAEKLVERHKWTEWGPHGQRVRTSAGNWQKPISWNNNAQRLGVRQRVFCASLADVFDNQAPTGAREELFRLIQKTPWLDWQLLTKRPENFKQFLPQDWNSKTYFNVWLGISAEDQETYDKRWPILGHTDAAIRFVSYEPALGPLSMMYASPGRTAACLLHGHRRRNTFPDWLIWGGESGPGARQMKPNWARSITNECKGFKVKVFGKQWGTYESNPLVCEDGGSVIQAKVIDPPRNGKGGALLDYTLYREFPEWPCREQ